MQRIILLVAGLALAVSGASAQVKLEATAAAAAGQPLPARPKSYVGDYAKVIDVAVEQRLETKLSTLRKRAGVEFVVVTLETTGAEDLFDYSLAAARQWKLARGAGDKGGILLMLAVRDRKWRVQLTDSLRVDLPESVLRVHGDRMEEAYRQGRMGAGVNLFVDGLVAHLAERRGFKNLPD